MQPLALTAEKVFLMLIAALIAAAIIASIVSPVGC